MNKYLNVSEAILITGSFIMILYIFNNLIPMAGLEVTYKPGLIWLIFPFLTLLLASISYFKKNKA